LSDIANRTRRGYAIPNGADENLNAMYGERHNRHDDQQSDHLKDDDLRLKRRQLPTPILTLHDTAGRVSYQ